MTINETALLDSVRVGQAERLLGLLESAQRDVDTAYRRAQAAQNTRDSSGGTPNISAQAEVLASLSAHARAVGVHAGILAAIATLIAAAALEKQS